MVGFVVTPTTWSSATRLARLPVVSRSRLRSSSQIETPLLVSSVSWLLMVWSFLQWCSLGWSTLGVGQRQKFGPLLRVVAQRSGQGGGDCLSAPGSHTAQRHAGVLGFQHDAGPASAELRGEVVS